MRQSRSQASPTVSSKGLAVGTSAGSDIEQHRQASLLVAAPEAFTEQTLKSDKHGRYTGDDAASLFDRRGII
ncbi:hypothetical protein KGZ13_02520, partial [Pseudomonas aeruginosa]|uniref:hypothetical protein n=1 Tax=Pseudomonas aeruginosa TaxID=287 RepID=UPI00233FE3C8